MDKKSFIWLVVIVIVAWMVGNIVSSNSAQTPAPKSNTELQFSDLTQMLANQPQTIKQLTFENGNNEVIVDRNGMPPATVQVPQGGEQLLITKAADAKVPTQAKPAAPSYFSTILNLLMILGPFVIIFLFFRMMMKQQQNVQKVGKAKTTQNDKIDRKTFADVAGCDEAVKKLKRITNFQRKRTIFGIFGARTPKGALLVGPSGTGKTLLAKAVAGELDGNFFSVSGSEFVEMFVGVGASRVRDTFDTATATAVRTGKPSVIFIDEIDAVGGKRSSGFNGGGHQEREQTLNQILVCMDGVEGNANVIVLAATNRADILDPALLRPGRFDYHVLVDLPDIAGRKAIFGIHTRNKPLADDVDLGVLAQRTYGYSGADIEAACNEAAILAGERVDEITTRMRAERKSEQEIEAAVVRKITMVEFDEGIDAVKLGEARTSRKGALTIREKKNTTYHEVGHAWLSEIYADPVVKVTVVPRERALGYTQAQPEGDRVSFSDKQAIGRVMMAMAGRAAQEVFLNTVDTGASNDFEQATNMTKQMVTKWGFSKLGRISVGEAYEGAFTGMGNPSVSYGPELSNKIDAAWMELNEACYKAAKAVLERDRDSIEKIVAVLLEKETILRPEWKRLFEENPPRKDVHVLVPTASDPSKDLYPETEAAPAAEATPKAE